MGTKSKILIRVAVKTIFFLENFFINVDALNWTIPGNKLIIACKIPIWTVVALKAKAKGAKYDSPKLADIEAKEPSLILDFKLLSIFF